LNLEAKYSFDKYIGIITKNRIEDLKKNNGAIPKRPLMITIFKLISLAAGFALLSSVSLTYGSV